MLLSHYFALLSGMVATSLAAPTLNATARFLNTTAPALDATLLAPNATLLAVNATLPAPNTLLGPNAEALDPETTMPSLDLDFDLSDRKYRGGHTSTINFTFLTKSQVS
jgi:hypothetical protein